MPDYNDDDEYINSLLLMLQDGNDDVYRADILFKRIILTGNYVEDMNALVLGDTQAQNVPPKPIISPSSYSKEYEMDQSTASWATPSHTSHCPGEELQDEHQEEPQEESDFETEVLAAARAIARDYRNERLFGKPYDMSKCIYIIDEFERRLLDFFQDKDEETAYKNSGGMKRNNRLELSAVISVCIDHMDHQKVYENYPKPVTLGQHRFIKEFRAIRGI